MIYLKIYIFILRRIKFCICVWISLVINCKFNMKTKNDWIAELLNQTIKDVELWKLTDKNQIKEYLERFKHERIIHLLVTTFVWLFFVTLLVDNNSIFMSILAFIMLILEWCYLWHYYKLENWVQRLNKLYIKMISKKSK